MEKQNKLVLSEEQLDALAQNLLPAMRGFSIRIVARQSGRNIFEKSNRVLIVQLKGIVSEKM